MNLTPKQQDSRDAGLIAVVIFVLVALVVIANLFWSVVKLPV